MAVPGAPAGCPAGRFVWVRMAGIPDRIRARRAYSFVAQ
jgi:hypothetical protein